MQRVKSLGVLSVAKISGLCYAALGLVLMPFFFIFGFIGMIAGRQAGGPGAAIGPIVGIVMAIMMPVFYGCMGFVMGALGSFIYNLMAGWVGGIEVELQIEPVPHLIPAPAAAPQP
jgi:hypothetical protein